MAQGEERKDWRKVRQMTMVRPDTPLTDVLKLLLDAGVSAVPVVDDKVRQCSTMSSSRFCHCDLGHLKSVRARRRAQALP